MKDIMDNNREALNSSYENREIQVRLDMSNQQVAFFLEQKLREAYATFAKKLMAACELPTRLASIREYNKNNSGEELVLGQKFNGMFIFQQSISRNLFMHHSILIFKNMLHPVS